MPLFCFMIKAVILSMSKYDEQASTRFRSREISIAYLVGGMW
ncbi:hypothetical protein SAMN05421821_116142 [Mucilaginibacter lappiensis]|uniref:Uncharacterized protein n=1 Tax=Mucilaginibacter lappiensis TaxID=354630 RepID=A0A1N7F5I1_9SPHI|nr:hypothetical protein [Mucilaginibacter lappiensis]MBB6127964.1 hypothetical protein [Mucilaginibacter lappiensis]SIR95608.1 hypothetical protein SAMN05421821_116142 [Mucilaginibacter lappiensis]